MALNTSLPNVWATTNNDVPFVNALGAAFSAYFDVEIAASGNEYVLWIREDQGVWCGFIGGQFRISSFLATFDGGTYSAGRIRGVIIWDGTTLKSWIQPVGGSITQDHNTTSYAPGGISDQTPGVFLGDRDGLPGDGPAQINAACVWTTAILESHRFGLLAGLSPAMVQPESLVWSPVLFDGAGDIHSTQRTSPTVCDHIRSFTTGNNFCVLKDPSTHEAVQYDSKYWGISGNGASVALWSSADLITWSSEGTVTTDTAESADDVGACDFIFDAGAENPYVVLYWAEPSGQDKEVRLRATADMSTWTPSANNPIFTPTGTNNGAEDFRVTLDGNSDWVAVFEFDSDGESQNQVGIALNTAARLDNTFAYQGRLLGGAIHEEIVGTSFYANPTICKFGDKYWCFFEFSNTSNSGQNVTGLATSDDPSDPNSWTMVGHVTGRVNAITSTTNFPNCALVKSGNIHIYTVSTTANQVNEWQYTPQAWVGASVSPYLGMGALLAYAAAGGGGDTELVVADAVHGHSADSVALVEQEMLAVADALHAHSADSVALIQASLLVVADATHGHAADNIQLSAGIQLVVADALHGHTAATLGLVQASVLAVQDATHGHSADSVTLDTGVVIAVADALHAHGVDNIALVQQAVLAIADALHAHAAADIVLQAGDTLTVADASHAHSAEAPTLTLEDILTVADAIHAHTADTIELTQASVLVVSDALHAHLADALSLQLPGYVPPKGRVFVVQARNTTYVVTKGKRTFNA